MNTPHDLAFEVGERLRSPEAVAQVAASLPRLPGEPLWAPESLLIGHPGIALLHAVLSRYDRSWANATKAHLQAAVRTTAGEARTSRRGLVELIPAAVLHRRGDGGFSGLLDQAATALVDTCDLTGNYDVVSGLTGRARTLMALADLGYEHCRAALDSALRALVDLTRPIAVEGMRVPGWWSAPTAYLNPDDEVEYPRGDFNAGLAHGVAGPLALLSIAQRKGYRVDGSVEAIERITEWLLSWRREDDFGSLWPHRISFGEQTGLADLAPLGSRTAWCYGTAGVARAVQLAGLALNDPGLAGLAVDALCGIFRRPWENAGLDGPTICHGEAGVLMIVQRAAAEQPGTPLSGLVDELTNRVAKAYSANAPFGFRHRSTGDFDTPGLLQGAAGVALVLANGADWDSFLLVA